MRASNNLHHEHHSSQDRQTKSKRLRDLGVISNLLLATGAPALSRLLLALLGRLASALGGCLFGLTAGTPALGRGSLSTTFLRCHSFQNLMREATIPIDFTPKKGKNTC